MEKQQSQTIIVNLFAGPGAGKSTMAAGLFHKLKAEGINCELVTEFAKELVWQNGSISPEDQLYVLGTQMHRLSCLVGKVDLIITDSPVLLNYVYNSIYPDASYINIVLAAHNIYPSINFQVVRKKKYMAKGRYQTKEQAESLDAGVAEFLASLNIFSHKVDGTSEGLQEALQIIKTELFIC